MHDVAKAINVLFKNWGNTYFRDLWERTNVAQRICLSIVKEQGNSDLLSIQQQSGLERQTVHQALEILLDRDLVHVNEQDMYQLATPIFCEWVERNESFISRHDNTQV
jgi:hypothetical protein